MFKRLLDRFGKSTQGSGSPTDTSGLVIHPEHQGVERVTFSPDGKHFASCGDGNVKLWNLDGWELRTETEGNIAKFSPDGKTLAIGNAERVMGQFYPKIALWDVSSARFLRKVNAGYGLALGAARQLAFSPDGNLLLVKLGLGDAGLYHVDSGLYHAGLRSASFYSFSQDGKFLAASVIPYYGIYIWYVPGLGEVWKDGSLVGAEPDSAATVWPDCVQKHEMVLTSDQEARGESLPRNKPFQRYVMTGADEVVEWAAFLPGNLLAFHVNDELRIWDFQTGDELLRRHAPESQLSTKYANRLVLATDGRLAASFDKNGHWLRVWEFQSGTEIAELEIYDVCDIDFSTDGRTLAFAGHPTGGLIGETLIGFWPLSI